MYMYGHVLILNVMLNVKSMFIDEMCIKVSKYTINITEVFKGNIIRYSRVKIYPFQSKWS